MRQRFTLDDFTSWPGWVQRLLWSLGDIELVWDGPPVIWSRA